jgi:hypothetical protein
MPYKNQLGGTYPTTNTLMIEIELFILFSLQDSIRGKRV